MEFMFVNWRNDIPIEADEQGKVIVNRWTRENVLQSNLSWDYMAYPQGQREYSTVQQILGRVLKQTQLQIFLQMMAEKEKKNFR